jgi:predicted lipoprotein with Yx(FWY)xxD motif
MLAVAGSIGLLAAACGGSSPGTANTPAPTPTVAPVVLTAMATVDGKSETVLTDTKGMTMYYYTPDKGGKVTCLAACAQAWPPLKLPAGATTAAGDKGVTGTLSTVANPEGGTQVTYNGWPLYGWVKDTKPGDTTGQNVGGKWFVVTPTLPSATA